MHIVFAVLSWCLLAVVASIRFNADPYLSDSERERLMKLGDERAAKEQKQLELLPILSSFMMVVRTLLTVAFVIFMTYLFGGVNGIVIATAGLLLVPLAFRLSFVCAAADTLRSASYKWIEKAALALRPVLSWLRERDINSGGQVLNSQEELLELIERSHGILSTDELERLDASLKFADKKVSDVMTPRSMIEAVPVNETLGPLVLDELYKTGHSRFPVFKGDLDHVVGMLYLHDLIDLKNSSEPARTAMQSKVYFIRDDKDLLHALHGFLSTRHHLFVVVNKYRETVGLLSLEDVMEALIGKKIVDEFDAFDDLRAVAEHNPKDNNEPKGKQDI